MTMEDRWQAAWQCNHCKQLTWSCGLNNKFFAPSFCSRCTYTEFTWILFRHILINHPQYAWYKPWTWFGKSSIEIKDD